MTTQLTGIRIISITRTYVNNTSPSEHYLEVYTDLDKSPKIVSIKAEDWHREYAIFHTADNKYTLEYDQEAGVLNIITMPRVKHDLKELETIFGITKENIL